MSHSDRERADTRIGLPPVPNDLTAPPLAEAKISAPVLRAGLIDRARVRASLDAGCAAALTLVAAPAGYGKTTAVRAWCADRDAALAWVRLDAHDNDAARMWTSIAAAVDRIRSGLGRPAMRRLQAGGSIEHAVDELANSILSFDRELVLVLDDLHAVTHADCISSLNHAVVVLPANAQLIVLARADPALRLPQLRAGGDLVEVRARELVFTPAEVHQLLVEQEGIALSADEVALLHARTEGWPAALFLAALWLRGADDPHEMVRAFGGDHRFIVDYLTAEVIGSLDDDSRSFLLRACVLRQFTPELCDAVLGRSDSDAVLAQLESVNPFVSRLERGGGYRVHSLFAEFAEYQLGAHDAGASAVIHRRASLWFRARGLCEEAVEHAIAAGDRELVADVLAESYLQLFRAGKTRALRRWLRLLDDDELVRHPLLAVGGATVALVVGGTGLERRRYLDLAHRAETECPERVTSYVRSTAEMVAAASIDRDVARAVEAGRGSVEIARTDGEGDASLVAALASYSRALYFAGDLEQAWEIAVEAIEHPDVERRPPGQALAWTALAITAVDLGWLTEARGHAERAKSIVDDLGLNRTWLGATAAAALGSVLAAESDLAAAESRFVTAEHFFRDDFVTVPQAWLLVQLADVRCRRGRLEQAQSTLQSATNALASFADGGRVPLLAAEVERELERARRRASQRRGHGTTERR